MIFLLASERAKKFRMVDLVASFLNWNPEEDEIDDDETGNIWIPQFKICSPGLINERMQSALKKETNFGLETVRI